MKQRLFKPLLLFATLAVAFLAGAGFAVYRGWGSPAVYVDVVNESGLEVRSIALSYESCGAKNQLQAEHLALNARTRFNFLACGEAGYSLTVELANGQRLIGGGGYAESNYRITEVVEPTRIRSEIQPYRL